MAAAVWIRILVLAVAVLAAYVYVYRRARALVPDAKGAQRALIALFFLGPAAALGGRMLASRFPTLAVPTAYVGFAVVLAIVLAGAVLVAFDAVRGLFWMAARVRETTLRTGVVANPSILESDAERREEVPASDLTRRDFLRQTGAYAAFSIGGSASLYGTLFGRHDYHVEELPVVIEGLPRTLDGFTIAQISDIHFGSFVREPELRAATALLRSARPDLIVMTGDLIDRDLFALPWLGRLVRDATSAARWGVTAIPGNHDYYGGDVDAVLATVERAGGVVLRNDGRTIGDAGGAFALLGVDDIWSTREGGEGPRLGRALARVPRDLSRILLCHNPAFFPKAAPHVALQLSGHTHGGQVQLGVNPADMVLPYGYVEGSYRRGDATLYVNRGFGTAGPPARVGSPPEVTKIVLVAA